MAEKKTVDDTYITEEGMGDLWDVWYRELHDGISGLTVKVDRIVESSKSEFQRIDVLDTKEFGKMLVLYGSLMVCEKDNNSYNEMLAHVPLFVHPSPKKVLVIGGGDCGCLTEVTKHPDVESITMCEIDEAVVEASKRHFPKLTAGLDDPRVRMIYDDGKKFIETTDEKFDIILLDLSDPVGPAAELFQKKFHQTVFEHLNDDGIMVPQTESPYYNQATVRHLFGNLTSIFPIAMMYTCFMPIYPSGLWSFAFCSKKHHPLDDFRADKYTRVKPDCQYYNDEVHRAAFALPEFIRALVK